jgi:hypothetical protein
VPTDCPSSPADWERIATTGRVAPVRRNVYPRIVEREDHRRKARREHVVEADVEILATERLRAAPVRRALAQLGIPRSTFYAWYERYLARGAGALEAERATRAAKGEGDSFTGSELRHSSAANPKA